MAQVILKQLSKVYNGKHQVLHDIDLDISDGELMVFVGPSGCGKSTLLRMIAGLEEISAGELHIGSSLSNHVPPAERELAMVFQTYALYPHMTVFDNMGFALKLAGHKKDAVRAAVEQAAAILQIGHLLDRKPKELSGGQRQRVAIGRAIVRKPQLFLFDEPLSNLDANLRVQMRLEICRLHQQLKTTMIYVTHDQVEAMTLGQRIAVFNGGRIEQVGTPFELYNAPANLFVAGFLGAPKMNLIAASVLACADGQVQVDVGGVRIAIDSAATPAPGASLTLGVRAEQLRLAEPGQTNTIAAIVRHVEYLGDQTMVYASVDGGANLLAMRLGQADAPPAPGSTLHMHLPARHGLLFDHDGRALAR